MMHPQNSQPKTLGGKGWGIPEVPQLRTWAHTCRVSCEQRRRRHTQYRSHECGAQAVPEHTPSHPRPAPKRRKRHAAAVLQACMLGATRWQPPPCTLHTKPWPGWPLCVPCLVPCNSLAQQRRLSLLPPSGPSPQQVHVYTHLPLLTGSAASHPPALAGSCLRGWPPERASRRRRSRPPARRPEPPPS